ncbi:hypothetical protein T492DRAFT_963006 [Pavlovales sp. CCMP2436]|nr:hypothetical protein T492DRAFT_963006 [Pavlovales sp. CCMP2436]|eukprot:CAMPEP_0179877938 /NCGR_PEP_ID=MMETSP0982-20121206/25049_1 /TAXON_ID=483367 /ORGANISM="non described non described, Strain CCMP 2436" /LENGTH=262 /DNA_ID=CAMNT_0021770555 /DNA_START=45 /DNA_END=833 /DNA_ORIENTATION=-
MQSPEPNMMARELVGRTELVVKQLRKGCLQECLGCEAKSEFAVTDPSGTRLFYLSEKSSCLIRLCCASIRPWMTTLTLGGEAAGGEPLVIYERPFRCHPGPMKCCCYQQLSAKDARTGAVLGSVVETLYCCVPQMAVLDAAGVRTHFIHQPTCCAGMCVSMFDINGGGCCKVPFKMYPDPAYWGASASPEPVGKIVKVWGGWSREILTDADTFAMSAPAGASSEQIAVMVGATLLINELFFESYQAGNTGEGREAGVSNSML